MITHLSINNLKLHDHTDLDLNGLTILTGMNGMGKSTVIQSLYGAQNEAYKTIY